MIKASLQSQGDPTAVTFGESFVLEKSDALGSTVFDVLETTSQEGTDCGMRGIFSEKCLSEHEQDDKSSDKCVLKEFEALEIA